MRMAHEHLRRLIGRVRLDDLIHHDVVAPPHRAGRGAWPVLIIGGLKFGIFTPTEAAVVAVVDALFVGTFIYRELRP